MTLKIEVLADHFAVSDGCEFKEISSCIVDSGRDKNRDRGLRRISRNGQSHKYLFYQSVALIYQKYKSGKSLVVKCPKCETEYTLGKKEFEIGVKAYRKLLESGELDE